MTTLVSQGQGKPGHFSQGLCDNAMEVMTMTPSFAAFLKIKIILVEGENMK